MTTPTEDALHTIQEDLKALGSSVSGLADAVAKSTVAHLKEAQESAEAFVKDLPETSRRVADAADRAIQEHPYKTAGVAAAVGLLVGAFLNRK